MTDEPEKPDATNPYSAPQAHDAGVQPAQAQLPKTVVAVGWVSLLTDVATEMVYPLLPRYITGTLGASKAMLGLLEGVAETTAALTRLPAGIISDRLRRRKPLMVLGYGVAGLVRPLLGVVNAPWQALLVRFADRFGKGIRGAPRDALITDVTDQAIRGRAFGFHRAMDHTGAAIGPLLAFAFLSFRPEDYETLFLLTLIPGVIVLGVLVWGVREPRVQQARTHPPAEPGAFLEGRKTLRASRPSAASGKPRTFRAELSRVVARGPFAWFLSAVLLFTLGRATELMLLLQIELLGVPVIYLTLLWSAYHVAKSALSIIGGRLSDRHARTTLIAGWAVHVAVYVGFAVATTAWQAVVLFLVYAFYFGLSEPAERVLVARFAGVENRGTAFGWYHLAIGLTTLPASAAFGWLWDVSPWGAALPFLAGAGIGLVAIALLVQTTR